ncbi:hypothetical protein B0H67DRAFT_448225, partial [Lasiosphaeris hirsuta]
PDPAFGSAMVVATAIMRAVSLPLFACRLYSRLLPRWRLSWDSYFLVAAVIFDLVQWVLILLSIHYGYGHSYQYVSPENMLSTAQFLFFAQPFSVWALSCAKISVAFCLLRIQRRVPTWRMFLRCLIVLQVAISAIINYFQFTMCKPFRANWDGRTPNSQCVDKQTAQISIFVSLAMTIFTDLTFSLVPLSL